MSFTTLDEAYQSVQYAHQKQKQRPRIEYEHLYDELFYDLYETWCPYGFLSKAHPFTFGRALLSAVEIEKINPNTLYFEEESDPDL